MLILSIAYILNVSQISRAFSDVGRPAFNIDVSKDTTFHRRHLSFYLVIVFQHIIRV